jgi:poly-gamma-glutamate capsule biosynthesis protein CapA/YwtB (metallophosphatase superfamily)
MKIFLCGDVMIGRGLDQALPHPCPPELHEAYVQSARDYLQLAEQAHGPIGHPLGLSDIWGAALTELKRAKPDARIINLETSLTRSDDFEPKGINYRASPENAACLTAAGIDCCTLANNHVLDFGAEGLRETLATLHRLKIKTAGAGHNAAEALAPAILPTAEGRLLVFALACPSSGVPRRWAAGADRAGVNVLPSLSEESADAVCGLIAQTKREGDVTIVSIHWGSNWGYAIPDEQRRFAHHLIEQAGVAIVHGHSSHHARPIEVYRDRLILYGCGDFLNDYEGITGYEEFRDDLPLMYFADVDAATGTLRALDMVPLQIRRFRLKRASNADTQWLQATLDRESAPFGTRVVMTADGHLTLHT